MRVIPQHEMLNWWIAFSLWLIAFWNGDSSLLEMRTHRFLKWEFIALLKWELIAFSNKNSSLFQMRTHRFFFWLISIITSISIISTIIVECQFRVHLMTCKEIFSSVWKSIRRPFSIFFIQMKKFSWMSSNVCKIDTQRWSYVL